MRRLLALALLSSGCICGALDSEYGQLCERLGCDAGTLDAGPADSGSPDSGSPDAGTPDAGAPDAGAPDAGSVPDAGAPDAGSVPDAGGFVDGGVDGGLCAPPGVDCTASVSVCCPGLCCANFGAITVCSQDPPQPPLVCLN